MDITCQLLYGSRATDIQALVRQLRDSRDNVGGKDAWGWVDATPPPLCQMDPPLLCQTNGLVRLATAYWRTSE